MTEIIVCGLGIVISIILFVFSRGFSVSAKPGVPSAAFFPTLISIVLLFLSILVLIKVLIRINNEKKKGTHKQIVFVKTKVFQFVAILGLMVLYAILWNYHIGHFILNSIIVFVPISILLSDEKVWWQSAIFSSGLIIFVYLLFTTVLRVRLW